MSRSGPPQDGTENVFADLGIEAPEEYLAKSELAARIQAAIEARGLTQKAAGALLGISQPRISPLLCGRLDGFSTDRLFRFLNLLGSDVRIVVSRPDPSRTGRVSVSPGNTHGRRGTGGMSLTGQANVSTARRKTRRNGKPPSSPGGSV
jgi:predicted XRE-type DNA-binding protein